MGLLRTPIPADFVIRDGVPAEKLVPKLEAILRRDFHLPIRLSHGSDERTVIVARGRYHYTPDPTKGVEAERKEPKQIQVYALDIAPDRAYPRSGSGYSLDAFLSVVAVQFGVRFISEVEESPKDPLAWKLSGPKYPATIPVEDQGPTLDHLTQQTGLTFAKEARKVRFLRVERAE